MELEINREEISKVLLEWADAKFPGLFNDVHIKAAYGTLECAQFRFVQPEPPKDPEIAK